jgi:hypothetical protein
MIHTTAMRQLHPKGLDMLPPKWKMRLTCQWQMGRAEERRRLFEDWTGRDFGQHAGETCRRLLEARRPDPRGIPVAGLEAAHLH